MDNWDGLGREGLAPAPRTNVELFDDDAFYNRPWKNNIIWLALYMFAVPAGLFIALFLKTRQSFRHPDPTNRCSSFPRQSSQGGRGPDLLSGSYAPNFGLFYNLIEC